MNHSQITSFLWGTADLIRDSFKRGKYQDVILPLTVLRRIDCVLEPTKDAVLEAHTRYGNELENPDPVLRKASGFAFYNTSRYTFKRLLGDAPNLASNLRNYIQGFSPNMREVVEKFDFDNTITKLDEAGLLFQVVERFGGVDLHPDVIPNPMMGTIFEELIRKFNEALNENPGEHFTPRDVVRLMAGLLIAGDEDALSEPGRVVTVYDPCCGSGGMLTITKDFIQGSPDQEGLNPEADVFLFGQEVNPETFAVCKSDLFLKSVDGRDAEGIRFGSTLADPKHRGMHFDYLIANPPYGMEWKRDRAAVEAEAEHGHAGRFGAGTPRISDGQLLFLQHLVSHMKAPREGGSRIALIMNGSPLFTGDAGSGESEIRRWVLENDWLETLIALPEQLFYNTGIATYVWILTNRKAPERKGKVQLIDATSMWAPMRKSLGDKRRKITPEQMERILDLRAAFEEGDASKIFATTRFGYRKVQVERPLRLNFEASDERIARLDEERTFVNLATSRKRDAKARTREESEGRTAQDEIRELLRALPRERFMDRAELLKALGRTAKARKVKLAAPIRKAILSALGERDENAEICRDRDGNPEPDSELRDHEVVPLGEDVFDFVEREVKPWVPDAWIDENYRDALDGGIGRVGYEINFNRYFYVYVPPRPLEEIDAEIREVEAEIVELLRGVAG